MITTARLSLALASFALGCSSDPAQTFLPDATADGASGDATSATIPPWMLEDIQPASPRLGENYGLETFAGRIVVVALVEGF